MAKDDFFKIVYCILKELYACKKQGLKVNKLDIDYNRFNIPYSYWVDIICELKDHSYIKGVLIRNAKGTGRIVNYDDIDITMNGIEYLQENSMMKKVKEALKDLKDIIPV